MFSSFEAFFKSLKTHPLIDASIPKRAYVPLDLSIHNSELKAVNVSSSENLEHFICNYIKNNNAKVAFGGYLEQRGIYQRSDYFNQTNTEEERNIHLGLDIWTEANTPIYTPLDGTIHSFKNNTNHGDYGPTLILKHKIEETEFYTLYGHLSIASIENLKVGAAIKQGEQIATLGTAEVNGDYPGVSNHSNLEFYKSNCLDPNLLLKLV